MAEKDLRRFFRMDISMGNVITLVGMFAVGVAGWTEFKANDEEHDRRIAELEATEREMRSIRLSNVQILTELKGDLKYLREAVTRIERKQMP